MLLKGVVIMPGQGVLALAAAIVVTVLAAAVHQKERLAEVSLAKDQVLPQAAAAGVLIVEVPIAEVDP